MLRVRLLGEVALEHDDTPVPMDSARLQSLIGLLVLRRDAAQDRARVAFELWPDSTESQARTNLRHLIHDLRSELPQIDQVVHTTNRTIQWRPQVPTVVDVAVFETALDEAAVAPDEEAVRSALEMAVAAYGGDLLPNSWDDWVLAARDRLRSRAIAALEALAGLLDSQNQDQAGRQHWERLVRLDPVNETAYRGLMRSYAAAGDRGRALRVYHTCVSVLERELGLPPAPETTEVYESLVRGDAASGRPKAAVATTDALVGREVEWAEVVGTWRRAAAASGPHVLVVTGEPGIGKSRIVEELARSCEAEGAAVARARAYEAGGRLPFLPVTDWLRTDLVARHVARLDRIWRAEVARLVPDVGDEEPGHDEYITDPGLRRRLLEGIGHAFSIGRPLLLVLDDVQWTDPDTIDVVHHLAHQPRPHPLLVAATVRDGEMTAEHPAVPVLHELRREGLLTEVALERLGREATIELVERLHADVGDPDRLEQLWRETEGNPLFVVEAARAGFPSAEGGLTKTVQSMILSRLASLSEPGRRITEVAATSGRSFTVELLTAASGGDEEAVLDALDELWHRRIIREQGAGYDFTHDKLREVAYAAVSPVRRRRLHRAIGDALESVHADDPTVSTDLAQHRERGGQYLEAISAHRAAARHALTMYATDDAMASLRQALTLLEDVGPSPRRDELELALRLELGAPMVSRLGYGGAPVQEMFDRALLLSRRLGLPPEPALLRGMAIGAVATCQFARSRQLGEELAQAAPRDPIAMVEGHYVLGVTAFWVGELASSSHHLDAAIAAHRDERTGVHLTRFSQDPLSVCLVRRALTEWYRGAHDEAWQLHAAALARMDELAHPYTSEYVLCYASWMALEAGEADELRRIAERGRAVWHHEGFFPPVVHVLEGWLATLDGRPDGPRLLEQGLLGWSRPDRTLHRSWASSLLARALLWRGHLDEAERAVAEARAWVESHGQHYIASDLLRLDGEIRAARGDRPGAIEQLGRARRLAAAQGALWLEEKAATALAQAEAGNA